ncbi:BapA/Bap/LapF family prefix-like domain-containing protein, partial [Stenoxybacter acetivorans]|uniref:BapA/Bap/LapF family prefix-like domain-containing protein n=1 Tax=Stenoxybacter acetivorans TaxID=422441 RepID=UPI00068FD3D6
MSTIEVVSKASRATVQVSQSNHIALKEEAVVKLNIGTQTVVAVKQEGNQLIVVLSNGEVITIDNFFDSSCVKPNAENINEAENIHDVSGNQLVIEDNNGNLVWAKTHFENGCLSPVQYYAIEDISPLLSTNADGVAAFPWLIPLLAYGIVGSIAAAGVSASEYDDNSLPNSPPKEVGPQNNEVSRPHVDPVNETDPITGSGALGATITVTLPDGTTVTTTVGSDGKWSIPNPGNLNPGDQLHVVQTDTAGNTSPYVVVPIADTTAPAKPASPVDYQDNIGSVQSEHSTAADTDDTQPG